MSAPSTSTARARRYGLSGLAQLRAQAMDALWNWGTGEPDRELTFDGDRLVPEPRAEYYRGIDIQAPADVVFRWLCQMRVAPYSYDWIDNYGRRSPQEWIPGLQRLSPGQRILSIFVLVEFERDRLLIMDINPRMRWFWGYVACTYRLLPYDAHSCRLVAKVTTHRASGAAGRVRRNLRWGELVMMRRQFLNFKRLAEATAGADGEHAPPAADAPTHGVVADAPTRGVAAGVSD